MNAAEKEWDQLDIRLIRYDQNREQTLLLKLPDGHVRHGPNMFGFDGYIQ
jgi:hypothetical protein